jgi:glycosyltransferase involved in cell wall biosynthesis
MQKAGRLTTDHWTLPADFCFQLLVLTFLLLNQTLYPVVMATGQYLTEVALRLVERGHQVTVVTSRRAYDQPETQFQKTETWRGIRIYRVGSTGFGKGAKWRRAADFASFLALCSLRLALLPRHDVVVALTSPPLISFLGAWLAKLRRRRFFYWVMDFNPDEAIAAGWLRPESLPARLLDRMSRFSLRQATKVIALDRFMRDRIVAKGITPANVVVIPPWSHDTEVKFDPEGRERFRKAHGLDGKFVVMYSGNHSPCHPLQTLLAAAQQLAADPGVVFCFVGGGSEWRKIAEKQKPETRNQKRAQ